jgi:hypothetical protein
VELVPGGASVEVDNGTKASYVALRCAWALEGRVHEALAMLRLGLSDVVPPALLKPFSPSELDRLLVGQPSIDVTEVRAFAAYQVKPTRHSMRVTSKLVALFQRPSVPRSGVAPRVAILIPAMCAPRVHVLV